MFYKFTIELNYSRDQNKYSDYDSDDKYSVYVSDGPEAAAAAAVAVLVTEYSSDRQRGGTGRERAARKCVVKISNIV